MKMCTISSVLIARVTRIALIFLQLAPQIMFKAFFFLCPALSGVLQLIKARK